MKKLLITGTTGFLGSRSSSHYKTKYQILAPTHSEMDITDFDSVQHYFQLHKPDIVLHCAAISDTGTCEKNPDLSYKVNRLGSEHITLAAKNISCKCVLCSSDQVYCGSKKDSANCESDILNPYNVYGKDKADTELSCLNIDNTSVHLRLAWMYDPDMYEPAKRNDFLTQLRTCVKDSTPLTLPINDKRGITNVWDVVKNLEKTFNLPGGVYNFGSSNNKSTYETALIVFETLGYDTTLLQQIAYQQPRNLTMSQDKINSFGIYFPSTEQSLEQHL